MIAKGVKPGPICTKLGLCTNTTEAEGMQTLADEIMKMLANQSYMKIMPDLKKRAKVLENSLPIALEKFQKWVSWS